MVRPERELNNLPGVVLTFVMMGLTSPTVREEVLFMIRRRHFMAMVGSVLVARPHSSPAYQARKLPIIAYLSPYTSALDSYRLPAFKERLRELGWIEGRTIAFEYRWAEGSDEHLAEIATGFVRQKVNVIVTAATPPALAMKQATNVIPIVFAAVGDPIGTGLVASLTHPGGNVTGLWLQQNYAAGKRLQMLREIVPQLRHVAIMANSGNPSTAFDMREVQVTARALGLEAVTVEIHHAEDVSRAFDVFKNRVQALYVCNDPLAITNRTRISTLALGARLPSMFTGREYVEAGGLISYGPNFADAYRRAAELVDKILRGAKPADMPVEQLTKFDLVLNLTAAKALELTIPGSYIQRADEII
jgi:putative ABC transport system substrate-binding protein